MGIQKIKIKIEPREAFRGFLETTKRWMTMVAHRRAGKTVAVVQKLIKCALTHQRKGMKSAPLRYAYIAPTRDQAKDIAWNYLKDYTHLIPGVTVNESELRIKFPNGAQIRLYSGENYERMRGLYFDGVVSDEDADINPNAFTYVILPCLLDYSGWHCRIGTPKGKDAFYRAYHEALATPDQFSLMLKASESGLISQEDLDTIRAKIGEDAYSQEMECDFNVARPGAIYAKAIELARQGGRVCEFEPHAGALVHTTCDIGSPVNTSWLYWQRVGIGWRLIDHDRDIDFQTTGARVAHMLGKGYNFGFHALPHDAESKQPNGMSFQQELEQAGLKNTRIIPRTNDTEIRINRMHEHLPNIYFRESKTVKLLEALESYHRKKNETEGRIEDKVVHDWTSHDADAFGYLSEAEAAGIFEEGDMRRPVGVRSVSVRMGAPGASQRVKKVRVKR